jgi:predicted enzyme related to lactoylglutathione lyase
VGACFVEFISASDLDTALAKSGAKMGQNIIKVEKSVPLLTCN